MGNKEILKKLPLFKLPQTNKEWKNNDEFMTDIINVSNMVIEYLRVICELKPTKELDLDYYTVIMGHMIRLYKLYDSLICLSVYKGIEVSAILFRSIIETSINLHFILESKDVDIYKKNSLKTEKRLWDEINENKCDPPLPIEKRMLESIKQTFDREEIDINAFESKRDIWDNLYDRAKKTDNLRLYGSFRGGSHFVHGTWHDLKFHQLIEKSDHYESAIFYTPSKPQSVDPATLICLQASISYINEILDGSVYDELKKNLNLINNWFINIEFEHENWINK
jgi:hypothetical protein